MSAAATCKTLRRVGIEFFSLLDEIPARAAIDTCGATLCASRGRASDGAMLQHPRPHAVTAQGSGLRVAVLDLERTTTPLTARCIELDLQHAIAKRCRRGIGIRAFGQRNRAVEAAVAPLAPVVAALVRRLLLMSVTLDDDGVLLDFDVDVLTLDARQIRLDDELAFALHHLDVRRPHRRCPLRALRITEALGIVAGEPATHAEILEQPVHLVADTPHHRKGSVA